MGNRDSSSLAAPPVGLLGTSAPLDLFKNNVRILERELSVTRAPVDDHLAIGGSSWGSDLRDGLFCRTIVVGEAF